MANMRTLVKATIDLGATSDVTLDMSAIADPYAIVGTGETNIVSPGSQTKVEVWTGPNRTGTNVGGSNQLAAGGRYNPNPAANFLLTAVTLYVHVLNPNAGGSVDIHLVGIDFPS